jgi:photosystem II stability/assembly factor-like uncharacterized protein
MNMQIPFKYLAALTVSFLLSLSAHAQRMATPPDGTDTVTATAMPSSTDQFADHDAAYRVQAQIERFGAPLTEAQKQAVISNFLQQKQTYGSQFAGANPPAGTPIWQSLGPTSAKYETNSGTLEISDSGRVRTILQSPTDPDTVFVLTSGGGLWKTTNFSQTHPRWSPKTDALLSTSGGSVAFGRSSNILYLGLGDPFDYLPGRGGMVTRSLDGGETWEPLVSLAGASNVRDIKVDTSGPLDAILVATDVGLFRSADGGVSFIQVASSPGLGFWSIVRTSAGWLASAASFFDPSYPGLVILSTDHGANWLPVGTGLPAIGRMTLATASPGEPIVYGYASTPDGSTQLDLFRSADGGLSWTALNITAKTPTNPNYFQSNMNVLGDQAWYNQLILVDRTDATRRTIYLGGQVSTAKTTDGGATWTLLTSWLPLPSLNVNLPYVHADCHFATSLLVNGTNAIAFGTDGGIFVSNDAGASWDFSKNNGIVSFLAQTIASSSKNPQMLISGMQDDGSRARLGSSSVFNQVTGGDGEGVAWSDANNAYTLTSTSGGRIISANGYLPNTKLAFLGVSNFPGGFFYTPLSAPVALNDPSGGQFVTATSVGVLLTGDGGATWFYLARVGPGRRLGTNFSIRPTWHTVGINLGATGGPTDSIAIGGLQGKVAISYDYVHYSFKTLLCPSPVCVPGFQGYISAPVWAPGNVLYVASESPIPGSMRVVRSYDGGASWAAAGFGLPDVPVYHLIADPRDASGNTMYAGTGSGVYKTSNGGASWTLLGAGLPNTPAMSLWVSSDGGLLRTALYGRGLWEIRP